MSAWERENASHDDAAVPATIARPANECKPRPARGSASILAASFSSVAPSTVFLPTFSEKAGF
jgi:hypothetical protein